jgi:hypothetical protein
MSQACPSEVMLSRALSEGPRPSLTAHLESCARCAKVMAELQQLRDLSRRVPTPPPTQAQIEQARTSMLASLAARSARASHRLEKSPWWRSRRGGVTVMATAAAAVAVIALVGWRRHPTLGEQASTEAVAAGSALATFHATVYPRPGARLDRQGSRMDDVVRLHDGGARFDVSPLGPGERFRVVAGDGEVEVRGTSFDVDVREDHLSAVRVQHGRVEVRVAGRQPVVVGAHEAWNESWNAASQASAPGTASAATGPTASEEAFVTGWAAFRAGRFSDAIAAFNQMLRLAPDSAMAEDAEYWRAIAFARSQSPAAADELLAFLRKYPRSAHADDALLALTRQGLGRDE